MSSVSESITDAVTQTNVQVVGDAPAMAMGTLYQTAAHSTGLMFENAVHAQNNQFTLAQTALSQGIIQIYS
ncbi:MAG: RebB family R body protein, partial [Bacteroidota bacterium]